MSKYDDTFFSILQQHPSEIEFLNTVFQFLQRRTPCFTGPNAEENFTVLINTLTHQRQMYRKDREERGDAPAKPTPAPAPAAAPPAQKTPAAQPKPAVPKKTEAEEIAEKIAQAKAQEAAAAAEAAAAKAAKAAASSASTREQGDAPPAAAAAAEDTSAEKKKEDGEEEDDSGKGVKPVGNGGTTDNFVWTQTLQEVTITVPLPPGTRANMLSVEMKQKRLKFGFKNKPPIVDGELSQRIKVEDSVWVVEGGVLVFTLSKQNQMEWWKCVCIGDPEINTSKVEPENSNLSDLDGDTRQVVEKMMFDQRQKAMGLPTSEEKKKQDMMAQFMKAHPEMDFSNCKFN